VIEQLKSPQGEGGIAMTRHQKEEPAALFSAVGTACREGVGTACRDGVDRRFVLRSAAQAAGFLTAGAFLPRATSRLFAADEGATPVVATRSGQVRGLMLGEVHAFRGIPYGGPTGGANRFLPARPPELWSGVRDTLEFGNYAPQSNRPRGEKQREFFRVLGSPSHLRADEDCLYLNVWTRNLGGADGDGGKRPVMVWLHGGGYDQGAGGSIGYDGAALARHHDAVVVSVNHRLNVLGYLFLGDVGGPDFADSANVGQLDLVAALRWVHDNIAGFGGDPERVMIFGQSGGGGKVCNLLAMPDAKGLFHAAVIQSGSSLRSIERAAASEDATKVMKALGLEPGKGRELQQVPFEALMKAAEDARLRLGPVVDGKVLPAHPFDPAASPLSADVPVMVGYTRTERTVYQIDSPTYGQLDEAGLLGGVERSLGAAAPDVIAAYRKRYQRASPFDLSTFIGNDVAAMSSIRLAERRNALGGASTYMYVFSWETPVMGLRAPHTLEIPFVFHHIEDCQSMVGTVTPQMKRLEEQTARAWVRFAKQGDPNHSGLPKWSAYTAENRAVMFFDSPCRTEIDPTGQVRKLLEEGAASAV
jgi:para-nitrobenzyl esterase